jgi:hypothetical protein
MNDKEEGGGGGGGGGGCTVTRLGLVSLLDSEEDGTLPWKFLKAHFNGLKKNPFPFPPFYLSLLK